MAQPTTTVVIKAKNEAQKGLQETKTSFQQFTDSLNQLTNGKLSQLASVISNPWTAAAAAIGAAGKALVDLTQTGVEAKKGFDQLEASFGSFAHQLDGILDEVDQTTLATKDDLESMAKSLSQYGLGASKMQTVLQTTADLATKTGRDFGTVQSAVLSALNGQDRALTKLVPEWKDYKEEAGDAALALENLGTKIHDSAIEVSMGSFSQTLDNMATNWKNIKDDLGETIVMNIKGSGILDSMNGFLKIIADKVGNQKDQTYIDEYYGQGKEGALKILTGGYMTVDELREYTTTRMGQRTAAGFDSANERAILTFLNTELKNVVDGYNTEYYNFIKRLKTATTVTEIQNLINEVKAWQTSTITNYDITSFLNSAGSKLPGVTYTPTDRNAPYVYAASFLEGNNYAATKKSEILEGLAEEVAEVVGVKYTPHNRDGKSVYGRDPETLAIVQAYYDGIEEEKKNAEDQQEANDEIIKNLGFMTSSLNTLSNFVTIWGNGYQAGDIGNTVGSIGSTISSFFPKVGGWMSLAGAGIGFIESILASTEGTELNDQGSAGMVAQYNGATTIHMNNYFEGANIVGEGGMTELAKILRDELENLSYTKR